MSVIGKSQRLDVVLGPNFRSVVIWAPHPENRGRGSQNLGAPVTAGRGNAAQTAQDRNFICIEPMAAITDAINLAHKGPLQRAPEHCAGRRLAGELLGEAERILSSPARSANTENTARKARKATAHPFKEILPCSHVRIRAHRVSAFVFV